MEITTISVVQTENLFISSLSLIPAVITSPDSSSSSVSLSYCILLSTESCDNIFAVPHFQTFPPLVLLATDWCQSYCQLPSSKYFYGYTHTQAPGPGCWGPPHLGITYFTNSTSLPNTQPNLSLCKRCSRLLWVLQERREN